MGAAGDGDLDLERDFDLELERFLPLEELLLLLLLLLGTEEGGGGSCAGALDALAGVDLAGAGDGKPIYDIYESTTHRV